MIYLKTNCIGVTIGFNIFVNINTDIVPVLKGGEAKGKGPLLLIVRSGIPLKTRGKLL